MSPVLFHLSNVDLQSLWWIAIVSGNSPSLLLSRVDANINMARHRRVRSSVRRIPLVLSAERTGHDRLQLLRRSSSTRVSRISLLPAIGSMRWPATRLLMTRTRSWLLFCRQAIDRRAIGCPAAVSANRNTAQAAWSLLF